jgi:hypothetical protein
MNYQKSGKDLMTVDEIAVMDGDKCILQLRGIRPFLSDKYDVTQHPLEDKISLVLIAFMVIIMFFDINSPLDEISNYWKLGQTMISVMENIGVNTVLTKLDLLYDSYVALAKKSGEIMKEFNID